jgi:N-methylhydantoinase A
VEFLNLRVRLEAATPGGVPAPQQTAAEAGPAQPAGRQAWFDGSGFIETPVHDRYSLPPGTEIAGPAIIEERESTLIVGPGGHARVADDFNIVVTLAAERESGTS